MLQWQRCCAAAAHCAQRRQQAGLCALSAVGWGGSKAGVSGAAQSPQQLQLRTPLGRRLTLLLRLRHLEKQEMSQTMWMVRVHARCTCCVCERSDASKRAAQVPSLKAGAQHQTCCCCLGLRLSCRPYWQLCASAQSPYRALAGGPACSQGCPWR
ncbi:hypothetical protein JKP88DRAFT_199782 [Tribonema minus]|uniref:Uncharacterized protein n=1 Tax=Tribonema minus TaxID=303371 RepID=A0A836CFA0_9STRA|nr:hypothetical protein JKP88DRAFT_199782 [Tribonema minus]